MKQTQVPTAAAIAAAFVTVVAPLTSLADLPPYVHPVGLALVAPLSGDEKAYGIQLSNGMILAIDDVNERRALADFAFVFHSFDDQGDAGVAQQQAEFSMVDPQTSLVVGHVGGQATFVSLPVYHEKGTPLIIPTSPLAELTRTGYDNVFRLCPTDINEGQAAARYAERTLKAKKAAVIYQQSDYGADAGAGFVGYAGGQKLLATKDFGIDNDYKNAAAVVDQVKAYAPDVLYLSGDDVRMGKVLAALREAGITAPALASQSLYNDRSVKAAGDGAKGLIVSACVPPIELMPTVALFVQHYQARFGRVTSYALMGYVAAQIAMAAVIQTHNADRQALVRQLSVGTFPTILGNYSFVRGGDVANPILYFYQYDGTQFKYLTSSYPNPLVPR